MRWAATCFVKIGRGGYDGRGQARIRAWRCGRRILDEVWRELGRAALRGRAGARSRVRDQRDGGAQSIAARCAAIRRRAIITRIRFWHGACCRPAFLAELESRAEALAAAIIAKLGIEGLLCVEMFVTRQGELLVNELAPRPHNSYHQSERGCVTSQFEQLVRATCNLPLGDTSLITPCAIVNLLGDVWLERASRILPRRSQCPACGCISTRSTRRAEDGRWGICPASGRPPDEALERVLEARKRL